MDRTKPFNTNCLQCGVSLLGMCQPEKRKYCSSSCRSKYILRQKKPGVQTKLWQHETEVYEGAMEMYWNGMGGAAIARFFNIPDGTVYSWIHDFGGLRPRVDPIKLSSKKMIALKSLKEKFKMATSADEWLEALRDDTDQTKEGFENINIQLVCGFLHGYSATKLATVVSESLKEDPLSGRAYAFCNKGQNTITVLAWQDPIYSIAKYVKTHGTFIWPQENLGKTIEITKSEFDRLLFLEKYKKHFKNKVQKNVKKLDFKRVSCYT